MGVALGADHLGALHEMAAVGMGLDALPASRGGEARPAGTGVVLGGRGEHRVAAAHAAVHARFVVLHVLAREGPLRALLAGNGVLLGCELLLPFRVAFPDLLHEYLVPDLLKMGLRPVKRKGPKRGAGPC